MQKRITDRLIKSLEHASKTYEIVDTEIKGFTLIVRPSGVLSFCLRYTNAAGVKKSFTLGKYGTITTTIARELAEVRISEVRLGKDIQADRKAIRAETTRLSTRHTVNGLFEDWAAVELVGHKDSGKEVRRMMTQHVLSVIGSLYVEDVRKRHIAEVLDPILTRGTPRMAKVILGKLRQMFRFALERELLEADPTATFKKSKIGGRDVERDRVLSDEEISELAKKVPSAALIPSTVLAIWTQLATCCRVGELLAARWEHIDIEGGTWYIPAESSKNNKPHTIFLSALATKLFEQLKVINGNSSWCYPNREDTGAVDPKSVTRQIADRQVAADRAQLSKRSPNVDALKLKGGKWTPHDLRRTGATLMTKLGVQPEVAERCLNHTEENRIKRIYQRYSYAAEMKDAWRVLGEHLEPLIARHPYAAAA